MTKFIKSDRIMWSYEEMCSSSFFEIIEYTITLTHPRLEKEIKGESLVFLQCFSYTEIIAILVFIGECMLDTITITVQSGK